MLSQPSRPWVLRPSVPEAVYTDRQEFLDYFYHAALEAIPVEPCPQSYSAKGAWAKRKSFSV